MTENTPIREICEQYELTQAGLAKRFGIPIRTVEQWCTGKRQPPEYVVAMIRDLLDNEVQHGKWIYASGYNTCSICKKEVSEYDDSGRSQYFYRCPSCGSIMDK